MKSRHLLAYKDAQIGVIVVLLSTILLAIGVSVSSRVIRQTQNEITRQESSQQLHQAESGADMKDEVKPTDIGSTTSVAGTSVIEMEMEKAGNKRAEVFSSDIDTVYLQVGETVRISQEALKDSDGNLFWELKGENSPGTSEADCDKRPSLLLTFTNPAKQVEITPVAPVDCKSGKREKYDHSNSSSNQKYLSHYLIADRNGNLVIEALYAPTYIKLKNLTTAVRSASANQTGEEARVVEQTDSHLTPNYVNNFTLFAGMNEICQGTFNPNPGLGDDDDGNPSSGAYSCD